MFLKALKNVRNQVIAFLIFQLTAQETQFLLAITLLMEMLLYALQPTAFPHCQKSWTFRARDQLSAESRF